jgi:hypothetical protein
MNADGDPPRPITFKIDGIVNPRQAMRRAIVPPDRQTKETCLASGRGFKAGRN